MHLTSESPFIWVYNETLPTKPNLSKWLFLTSECLFLTPESHFLTSECLFLTSESPFIWVYNQTPTKPNLSESLFPMSECLFPSLEEKRTSGEYIFLFHICKSNYIYNYYKKSADIYMICQIIHIQIRNSWEISQPVQKLKLKELDNCQVSAAESAQSSNTLIFCGPLVLHLQFHPKHPHPTSVTSPTVPRTRNTANCWVE